jgi:hypothetical protein
LLVTVIFAPGLTVILEGEKLKFWMVIVADPPVDGEPPPELVVVVGVELEEPELQAPARTATPKRATATVPTLR